MKWLVEYDGMAACRTIRQNEPDTDIMTLRKMTADDIEFAAAVVAAEGWLGETPGVFEGFVERDPDGCLVAACDERPVGMCIATAYGACGFIGELIVEEKLRGRGFGKQLFEAALEYLDLSGAGDVYLDADPSAVSFYERNGFRKICRSLRFVGKIVPRKHASVRQATQDDVETILILDKNRFGADRSFFLKRRLRVFPALCHVLVVDGELAGYIMAQPGIGVISVGPWLVRGGDKHAGTLIEALASKTKDIPLRIGVLESNQNAVELIRSFKKFQEHAPCWRMVRGNGEGLGFHDDLYAIGSAAKG